MIDMGDDAKISDMGDVHYVSRRDTVGGWPRR
jgi:hypothetical protein